MRRKEIYDRIPLSSRESNDRAWKWAYEAGIFSMPKWLFDANRMTLGARGERPSFMCRFKRLPKRDCETLDLDMNGYFVSLDDDGIIQPYSFGVAFKGLVTHFNMYWRHIVDLIYYMVHVGGFSEQWVLNEQLFVVMMVYNKLEEDIKEENERKAKEAEEQAQMYEQQRQMWTSNASMDSFTKGMNFPTIPH